VDNLLGECFREKTSTKKGGIFSGKKPVLGRCYNMAIFPRNLEEGPCAKKALKRGTCFSPLNSLVFGVPGFKQIPFLGLALRRKASFS